MHGGIAWSARGVFWLRLLSLWEASWSTETAGETARKQEAIFAAAWTFDVSPDVDAVMSLSFMSLCVIPALKVNTRGLFDVGKFTFVPVDAE